MCFLPELIFKFHPVRLNPTLFKKAVYSGYLCLGFSKSTTESIAKKDS
ncbi:hypothetical protein G436_2113 [Leptospira interrogans serovar Hardjo str. Norma]|uniref:Uncharacterized protein n=1 Tax=Leptospira interrogans serovar Hardjo str. Norma TaxID=1279460 RepID=A0A0M4MTU3_LEPIR|nr:hypothetical protein G436_2113 [Leptospira interrogans serovar Hardjo str. Norma]EKO96053.1 hypothetical protein LEP1GSC057_2049 [Leptospira interrogans str. Brem 329]